jgi:DNA-binding LacI/PurR family transcriptional regulator
MVRLKDIAERAGVSVMTVSKVLRNAPDISASTKARIKALAEEMGYVPDSMAQGLRNRTTKLFGLVISSTTNPTFARLVVGIEERVHELGYDLIIAHSLNELSREEAVIRRMLSRRVDGIFLSPVYRLDPSAAIYEELKKRGTPTVILGPKAPFCAGFANVETEDLVASYHGAKHLIELGHRRIAYLGGPSASPSTRDRLEGYRRALREAGLEVHDSLIFQAGNTIEEGERAAKQMIHEMPDATAVQCFNDLVAIGAANTFLNQGLSIPGDLSVVGFGNVLVSEFFRVPLTTLRQAKMRLGYAAVEQMQKLLRQERADTIKLPAELIVRKSSGPPAPSPKNAVPSRELTPAENQLNAQM